MIASLVADLPRAPAPAADGHCAPLHHAADRLAQKTRARLLPHHRLLPRADGRRLLGQGQAGPDYSQGSTAGHLVHGGGRDGSTGQRRLWRPCTLSYVLPLALLRR